MWRLTRGIEQEQQKIEAKQRARVAGRFGLDLLGEDADEETMIAYAQLLSPEEQERKLQKATAKTLPYDATPEEIEEHMRTLSEEELARIKFASWPKRFEMSTSGSSSIGLGSPSVTTSPHVSGDNDLARALELSMQENKLTPPLTPPRPSGSRTSAVDDDVAEGIRRSLDPNHSRALASPWASPKLREEDELERAIRLSLESADNASSSSAHMKKHRENSIDLGDEGDFPALSSSPQSSPPAGGRGAVWDTGKGKKRAW